MQSADCRVRNAEREAFVASPWGSLYPTYPTYPCARLSVYLQ